MRNGRHFTLPQEQRGQQRPTSLLCLSLSAGRCLANKTPVREIYLEDSTWRGIAHQLASQVVSSVFSDEALKWPNHILKYVQNQPWYSFNSASLLLCRTRGVAPKTFGVFCQNFALIRFPVFHVTAVVKSFVLNISHHFAFLCCLFVMSCVFPSFCLCSILAFSLFQAKCLIFS